MNVQVSVVPGGNSHVKNDREARRLALGCKL